MIGANSKHPIKNTMLPAKPKTVPKVAGSTIAVLTKNHRKGERLFTDFEKRKTANTYSARKAQLVHPINKRHSILAKYDEEIFKPPLGDIIDDYDFMDETDVELAATEFIAQISRDTRNEY